MQHGVLGSYEDDGDDTILYMEPVFGDDPRENCFAHYGSAGDGELRPWLYFIQMLQVPDINGKTNPQYFELETCVLRDGEFVPPDEFASMDAPSDDDGPMLLRLKGRFAHFRFGRCKFHVEAMTPERGQRGLYFPMGFADERVDWIAENTTGAWSMRVFQPETGGQRFGLEFSFSSERDAVLFKTWWCG